MSAKGLRVFVVEDEPMIRIMPDMLGELGHASQRRRVTSTGLWNLRNPPNSTSLSSMSTSKVS